MTAPTDAPPPHIAILMLVNGAYVAGTVSALAELGIPDRLTSGPKTAAELAKEIGANPEFLYRLMRATACAGVLAEDPDGKFSQTPMSAALCKDGHPSVRGLARMTGREWHGLGWSRLSHSVRTGKRALDETHGPLFQYFAQNPEEAEIFDEAMTSLSSIDGPAVADAYSFDGIHSLVDIAGGRGLLLATILERNPHMRGTLYEMPHVCEGAKTGPLQGMMDRCTMASGDMFSSVPSGADAYIMKHIIHDWPDADCIQLLQACRKGINPGGKLLVVDCVIPPGNDFSPVKFYDLQMMVFPGGKERTEPQFRELLAAGGWKLTRIIPTAALDSIVEAVPA